MGWNQLRRWIVCASLAALVSPAWAAEAPAVRLASNGKAALPVVVSAKASPRVQQAAATLAKQLSRISGAEFAVSPGGDGQTGIALGTPGDFAGIKLDPPLATDDPIAREDYMLRSHAGGLQLIGATDLAVEHAVWDLLHRLGYRQFFPGPHWEVVPSVRDLSVAVESRQRPSYHARRIWYGFGAWDYAAEPYRDWCAKNRATSGIELNTGHAYDGILKANKAVFDAHPEYLGLVGGVRKSSKFCISNPAVRKLIADHAVKQVTAKPGIDSVSIDPSDGGGWCECAECAKLGSVTDQAILLANDVATAVNAKKPGTLVGIYAYNYHSPPPNIAVHPQVVASVATAFIKGGMTLDELLAGWSSKAKMLGIREYYSVNTWDRDQPAAARGGNLAYLIRTIPEFHGKGARFLSAESSDNWGPNGLGYFLAARLMWDVAEAKQADAIVDDFLSKAFGPAKEPMHVFYEQIDGSKPHLLRSDQLGRMFRALADAKKLAAGDAAIGARLDDLTLYARYADLYERYAKSEGPARQQAFEQLIRHAYRMRSTMLVHTKALYRDLAGRDKSVIVPADAKWNVPDGKNPWKSSVPYTADELAGYLKDGTDRYPLSKVDFAPVAYSSDLVPAAAKLKLPAEAPPGNWPAARGRQTFYTSIDNAKGDEVRLLITGGLIAHYRDRGNVKIEVWKLGGASKTGEKETLAATDRSVPPDGNEHAVKLTLKEPGLYRVTLDDGSDRTLVKWDCPLPVTITSSGDEPMNKYYDQWLMYFYVPKGTKQIGFFGGEHGELRDSANRPVFWLNGREPNYYAVAVPDGEDGKLWSVRYGKGAVRLLTVPPCFAPSPGQLLLPREVVEKDGR